MLSSSLARQIPILERPLFTSMSGVLFPDAVCSQERTSIAGDPQKEFLLRDGLREEVIHRAVTRGVRRVVVGVLGREELGMVTCRGGPWAGEIVRHDVDVVEFFGGFG